MNIVIVGVSGFIGRHLYQALSQRGHHVTGWSRHAVRDVNWQAFDFNSDVHDWDSLLEKADIVINAVGIYTESASQRFTQVQDKGPIALFSACRDRHIKVIQLSAIGAEQPNPVTAFLASKRHADQYLLDSDLANVVLYPGIVLGEGGRTTQQLSLLSRLIMLPLVFDKRHALPLISVQQLTEHIVKIIDDWPATKHAEIIVAQPETIKNLFQQLRVWQGLGAGYRFSLPGWLIRFGFTLFPRLSFDAFNKASLDMIKDFNSRHYDPVTDETATNSLLTHNATHHFKQALKRQNLFYFNLLALTFIWVMSGISSIVNLEQSRELVMLLGINLSIGDMLIYTAAVGDILLGVFLWSTRLRRWVIYLQLVIMVIYSVIVSVFIPIYWLHPFAPIVKNIAMVVLALYLLVDEKGKDNV